MMYGYGNMFSPSNRLFSGSGANPLWNGLLAYYTADNTPNDALGTYNGTLINGATYGTGIINQGFSFDGVNDYVDLGDILNFDGSTPFSVSLWYYPTSLSGQNTLFGKQDNISPFKGYQLQMDGNKVRFTLFNSYIPADYMIKRRSFLFSINTFYHIVMTYDGSKNSSGVNIYINELNGVYDVTTNLFTTSIDNTGIKTTISSQNGSASYASGIIDEVGVWNRELTSIEVTELYNSGAGKQYPN